MDWTVRLMDKVNVRPAQGADLTPPGTKQQGQLSDHAVLRRCIRESIHQLWNLFLRQYPNVDFLGFGMFCTGARVLVDQSPLDTFLKDAGEHGLIADDAVVVQLPVLLVCSTNAFEKASPTAADTFSAVFRLTFLPA